jgi:Uma2 family endonuclease
VFRTPGGKPPRRWDEITSLLLVIEILSPGTERHDRTVKRRRYQSAGVPEYWIVDLDARLVERWRPGDERPEVLADRLDWRPDAEGDTLELELPALYRKILGD